MLRLLNAENSCYCLSIAVHIVGQNTKSLTSVSPLSICGQDCDHSFGPTFTKFGTQLSLNILKIMFFFRHGNGKLYTHVQQLISCAVQF